MTDSQDPFAPPAVGDVSPFVRSFNTVDRSLEALRNLKNPFGQLTPAPPADGTIQRLPVPHNACLVRNNTGAPLDALSILKTGATIQSIDTQEHDIFRLPALEGDTPDSASNNFVVLLEPAGDEGGADIVTGAIGGFAVCQVDVLDTTHDYAAPTAGTTEYLTSRKGSGPARILSPLTTTGVQNCAVFIDSVGDPLVRIQSNNDPANGDPATTVTIYAADNPTGTTPAVQFTVQNDSDGAGTTLAQFVLYPNGTDNPGISQSATGDGTDITSVVNQYTVGDTTVYQTITESSAGVVQVVTGNPAGTQGTVEQFTVDGSGDIDAYLTQVVLDDATDPVVHQYTVSGGDVLETVTGAVDFSGATVTGAGGTRTSGTVAADGSTQGDAVSLAYDTTDVTAADGTKGVILRSTYEPQTVYNSGGSALKVYPPSGQQINGAGTNTDHEPAAGTAYVYWKLNATDWQTSQLGA